MKPASALILIGLLLLGLAGVIYYMHNARVAEGSSSINNDSPPTSTQASSTQSESSSTTSSSVPTLRFVDGSFSVKLLNREGGLIKRGSSALALIRYSSGGGNDYVVGEALGNVVFDVEGSGRINYVVEVYAPITPVNPTNWKEPQPMAVVPVMSSGGGEAVFVKSGSASPGSVSVPWYVNASKLFIGYPNGLYNITFYCKVSISDGYGHMITKFSGPVSFEVMVTDGMVSWVS